MNEYFVRANSFAAPIVSDTSTGYQEGDTAEAAMLAFVEGYSHPSRLYSANLYASADDFHKGRPTLVEWMSNHALLLQHDGCATIRSLRPGLVEVNGEQRECEEPYDGKITKRPARTEEQ